jgi:hypothetical protein
MAKKVTTTTTIVDDLDGTPIEDGQAESIKFSFEGTAYEIDLSKANAKALRDALKPYTKSSHNCGCSSLIVWCSEVQ